jgi:large subunit ribosomal protein L32
MPNPKRRHSKARRDKRRAHDALSQPSRSECPRCREPKLPHRVCAGCGYYMAKGKLIQVTAGQEL